MDVQTADNGLTKDQLLGLVKDASLAAIGPAVEKALEPVAKAQTGFVDFLAARERKAEADKLPKGVKFARAARILALGKGDPARGIWEARRNWGAHHVDGDPVASEMETYSKALTASNAAQAGNMILPDWSREFIELLRNAQAFGRIPGVRYIPMPAGSITMRKQTAAGTAYYVGESANITPSQQTVGTLTMSYKKLTALTPVSNDLLRMGGVDADMLVRDDLLAVVQIKRDLTFLTGDGLASAPAGVLTLRAAANTFAQTGVTLADVQADYTKLIRLVQAANIQANPTNSAYVMSATVKWGLYKLATTTGDMIFRAEMDKGTLFGFPIVVSEQVGNTRVFFIHGPSCLIGETYSMRVEAFDGAAYDDSGTIRSGVSRDETVVRVIDEHDFALRHDVGASILTSVTIT